MTRVNVFGMGYVGCVSAACLADRGHDVMGVDVDETKVSQLNSGRSPVVEPGLDALIARTVAAGRLRATTGAVRPADISLVCVGTPSLDNGSLGLDHVRSVARQIGCYLRGLTSYHVVAVRSTVLPGTVEDTVVPLLEEVSGRKAGLDFGVCVNPEFMRESTSIADFEKPSFTLIGELDGRSGDAIARLYSHIQAPVVRTPIPVAEMVKYVSNAFHGLKVTFANEIGNICKRLGIDSQVVMDIFCRDTALNLSAHYLRPGFAFGGSCLPKDIRALLYNAHRHDLECPVLESILRSNRQQVELAYHLVRHTGRRRVGVLGLSFKPGSDDLRESPLVSLIETLIGKGHEVRIYDEDVSLARIIGANRRYIEEAIPHISSLLRPTAEEVVEASDVIVVGRTSAEVSRLVRGLGPEKAVVDLVRIGRDMVSGNGGYEGICW
jgi:GDP-mannose 6-dehydrogenase